MRVRKTLEPFHFDGCDRGVHNKDAVVFSPIGGAKKEAVSLRVVVSDAADDLAIAEFHGDGASRCLLRGLVRFCRKENCLQLRVRDLGGLPILAGYGKHLESGIDRLYRNPLCFSIPIPQNRLVCAPHSEQLETPEIVEVNDTLHDVSLVDDEERRDLALLHDLQRDGRQLFGGDRHRVSLQRMGR
jgi:hypothetical protein